MAIGPETAHPPSDKASSAGGSHMASTQPTQPSPGAVITHLVLTVRDLEASHRFYTEILGYQRCAVLEGELALSDMWFYRTSTNHHDLALVQVGKPEEVPPPPQEWLGFFPDHAVGLNHFAVGYPNREAWLAQIEHMTAMGVTFDLRGNHGMTHSAYLRDPDGNSVEVLYDLPKEVWDGDVNAALNYFEFLPTEGPGSLEDSTDYQRFEPAPS
jgi:catechol-2,3-dioxygenase